MQFSALVFEAIRLLDANCLSNQAIEGVSRPSLEPGTCLALREAFRHVRKDGLAVRRLDMMWAFFAVIAAMGLALVKVRRQRKIREARGSQAAA